MAELPSGTVTFLFSDIEGSTRLLTRLRRTYAEVLGEHQRLLRGLHPVAGKSPGDSQKDPVSGW
jgi:hypothetical protein